MENRFEQTPPEEQGWGVGATPPPGFGPAPRYGGDNTFRVGHTGGEYSRLCASVREMLPHLLENEDGEVRPEMAAALYSHLTVCPGCAETFDSMQKVVAHLAALPPVELPMDFSSAIMRRIQLDVGPAQNGVVPPFTARTERAVERSTEKTHSHGIKASVTVSQPQTIAQNQTHVQSQTTIKHRHLITTENRLGQRLIQAGLLAGILFFFLASAWGRALLGMNLEAAGAIAQRMADGLRHIPGLSGLSLRVTEALWGARQLIAQTYSSLGAVAMQNLIVDAAVGAAGGYYMVQRRQKSQSGQA